MGTEGAQAHAEGHAEGEADGLREGVRLVLLASFGALDDALSQAIEHTNDETLRAGSASRLLGRCKRSATRSG